MSDVYSLDVVAAGTVDIVGPCDRCKRPAYYAYGSEEVHRLCDDCLLWPDGKPEEPKE